MISVQVAQSIVNKSIPTIKFQTLPLMEALHHTLADAVYAPINMPPFRQSNMDGYALHTHDALSYELVGEIKAGDAHLVTLQPGQAVKLFTGAAVPDSATAVIQIEKTSCTNNVLEVVEQVVRNTNIRPIGEQIKVNELALPKETFLNAAAIGFLAGLGITQVTVYKKPSVGILVTGNELVTPGTDLEYGKIYESNSMMLEAALRSAHFTKLTTYEVQDDFESTKNSIEKALSENDILLISGGISVGDYDFVKSALDALEVETLFYKVNQKPGKPLLVGKRKEQIVFALPGNPAASLTCYYIYVQPLLHQLAGNKSAVTKITTKELAHDYSVLNTRSLFLKAVYHENEVTILNHQDSSMLNTFALANCLVQLPEGNYSLAKGTIVTVYRIDSF